MQNTLVQIKLEDDNGFFLLFDTEINDNDVSIIKKSWKQIAEDHPNWGKYDIVAELTEDVLPKFGLQGVYITPRKTIEGLS